MTFRLNLRTGIILVAVLAVIGAGIAYGATQISRGVGASLVIGQIQTTDETILLRGQAPPSTADLAELDFGAGDIDAFGFFVTPPRVPIWASNGGGVPFKLTVGTTDLNINGVLASADALSLLVGAVGEELVSTEQFVRLIRPDDPPMALEAGLKFLKSPQELGITTAGDTVSFTAIFSADAIVARLVPTALGDVKTLFTDGIAGGPALRHAHGTAYDTDRGTLWVTDAELDGDIFEFDVSSADGSTVAPLTRLDVPLSGGIQGIGFDPEDNTVYYVDGSGKVHHMERDGTPLGSFQTEDNLGLAVQGAFVWVDNGGAVFKYHKVNGEFTGVAFRVGSVGLAFDFDRDLLWTGHDPDGRFRTFDMETGELVFESNFVELPNGDGRGHNLGYGAGRLWVATETLEGDVIYGIQVIAAPVEIGPASSTLAAPEIVGPRVTPESPIPSGQ